MRDGIFERVIAPIRLIPPTVDMVNRALIAGITISVHIETVAKAWSGGRAITAGAALPRVVNRHPPKRMPAIDRSVPAAHGIAALAVQRHALVSGKAYF